jgi:glucose-1-phosphate cytidylyltransferase
MKVVILAGGLGTRLPEYTKKIPKPMVKVAGYPIIIHIIKHYLKFGFNDFIIATGYKGKIFENYFANFKKNGKPFKTKIFKKQCKITIFDTGLKTLTGGRLKRISKHLNQNEDFMFTYGDGLSDLNLRKLLKFHKSHKRLITVTAVRPPARFGELIIKNKIVTQFKEKPQVTSGWINGGYFVAKLKFLTLIKGDQTILEKQPLESACRQKELMAFEHFGFWKCMDTKRDRDVMNEILKKKI